MSPLFEGFDHQPKLSVIPVEYREGGSGGGRSLARLQIWFPIKPVRYMPSASRGYKVHRCTMYGKYALEIMSLACDLYIFGHHIPSISNVRYIVH
jgi:hypothetical protein